MQFVAIQAHDDENQSHKENLAQQHAQRLITRQRFRVVFTLQRAEDIIDVLIDDLALFYDGFTLLHRPISQRDGRNCLVDFLFGEVRIVEHILTQSAIEKLG